MTDAERSELERLARSYLAALTAECALVGLDFGALSFELRDAPAGQHPARRHVAIRSSGPASFYTLVVYDFLRACDVGAYRPPPGSGVAGSGFEAMAHVQVRGYLLGKRIADGVRCSSAVGADDSSDPPRPRDEGTSP